MICIGLTISIDLCVFYLTIKFEVVNENEISVAEIVFPGTYNMYCLFNLLGNVLCEKVVSANV